MTKQELEATDFNLGSGDDKLIVDANVDANITAHGGSGDDVMIGGKGNDHFYGGSGDDRLVGGGGRDELDGGSGNNQIFRYAAFPLPTARFPELIGR
jgi:Ca2+-binding RTX toxin-like protein